MLIALSQAFHSNRINLDPLLLSLRCLQLLFAFGTITLLLFDQFNLHMERTRMNANCVSVQHIYTRFILFIRNSWIWIFMSAIPLWLYGTCSSAVAINVSLPLYFSICSCVSCVSGARLAAGDLARRPHIAMLTGSLLPPLSAPETLIQTDVPC